MRHTSSRNHTVDRVHNIYLQTTARAEYTCDVSDSDIAGSSSLLRIDVLSYPGSFPTCVRDQIFCMEVVSGSLVISVSYRFRGGLMFVRARRGQWCPLTPFVCESVVTLLSAASAFRRSVSLKLFERPPPGVLAPDMTEFARERTFITSGLDRVCQYRPRPSEQKEIRTRGSLPLRPHAVTATGSHDNR